MSVKNKMTFLNNISHDHSFYVYFSSSYCNFCYLLMMAENSNSLKVCFKCASVSCNFQ